MQVKSKGKFIRISPIKARMVVRDLRGKSAERALVSLLMMPQKGAKIVAKVLKSAIADAEHNYLLDKKELQIESITIDKGPSFRRSRPSARGSVKPIEKKTSHITVTVSGENKIEKIKKAPIVEKKEAVDPKNEKDIEQKIEEKKSFPEDRKDFKKQEEKGFHRFFRRKTG